MELYREFNFNEEGERGGEGVGVRRLREVRARRLEVVAAVLEPPLALPNPLGLPLLRSAGGVKFS